MLSFLCPATPVTAPFAALTNQLFPQKKIPKQSFLDDKLMKRLKDETFHSLDGGP